MSAIQESFARCRVEKRAAFIPFLVAGHPNLDVTSDLLDALVAGGADLIELGVPFSDPVADGPIIQAAAQRALDGGTTLSSVLDLIARKRDALGVPIVLFTYFNPIHARGVEAFAEQAASSGVDGVLCVDLPPEEGAKELVPALRAQSVDAIFLIAPTSTKERVKKVTAASSGFIYYVARRGVTGAETDLGGDLIKRVKRLRRRLPLPLAVGFGIATPEQAAEVGKVADGVVVGSALVKMVEASPDDPELAARVEARARELSAALRS